MEIKGRKIGKIKIDFVEEYRIQGKKELRKRAYSICFSQA